MVKPYEPSRKRIRTITARIQATWNERERLKRAGFDPEYATHAGEWTPPIIPLAFLEA